MTEIRREADPPPWGEFCTPKYYPVRPPEEFVEGHGRAEQVTLAFVAAETTKRRRLLSALNSLGDEFEAKAQTQADDCLDDGCVAGAGRHSVNEGAVDLQTRMATGTVKWFNATKSFGFIQPDGGGQDVFVHTSAVERAGVSTLVDGQKVNYRIEQDRRTGKLSAGNLSKAG